MKAINEKLSLALLPVLLMLADPLFGQTEPQKTRHSGIINGTVFDAETRSPLPDANIVIDGTVMGASTGAEGRFKISRVPVGSYTLKISYAGYKTEYKTDIIVKSNRITFVQAELSVETAEADDIVIMADYFPKAKEEPVSSATFSSEEIRRAPGSAGDVSRIIMGLPSVAKVNDQVNSLIVRGGSPTENIFLIDNIRIPNINHYPTEGSTGGPISMINVDFIKDVGFYTGGFSAAYGNSLSSVMNLSFRDGNRSDFDAQADLNFAGFGLIAEGPLFNKKGSAFISARRSFLDLLVDAIGTGVAPRYSDYQGKLTYDISPSNKLMIIDILGVDYIGFSKEDSEDMGNSVYGDVDITENTAGMNLRTLWGNKGFSNTSLSHSLTKRSLDYKDLITDETLYTTESADQSVHFRNENSFRLNDASSIKFGAVAHYSFNDYDYFFDNYTDALGNPVQSLQVADENKETELGAFAEHTVKNGGFSVRTGIRYDYTTVSERSHVSPRLSISYEFTGRTSLSLSAGVFYQNLPLVMISQNDKFRDLKTPEAYHYVASFKHLLTANTRLTIEGYLKEYRNFPLDPTTPSLFIIDELLYRYGMFFNHESLIDNGEAYSRGIEVILQKKLAQNFYGIIGGSYFRSRYRDLNGQWRDRIFDNRFTFNVEGGYKPNNRWEFSLRWIYAGGIPYTPFDQAASAQLNRGIFDSGRINAERYPDYHSLNIRFDRRFNFNNTNLTTYLSFWNTYNRKNVAGYFWNEFENKQELSHQWGFLPIFGVEYEF